MGTVPYYSGENRDSIFLDLVNPLMHFRIGTMSGKISRNAIDFLAKLILYCIDLLIEITFNAANLLIETIFNAIDLLIEFIFNAIDLLIEIIFNAVDLLIERFDFEIHKLDLFRQLLPCIPDLFAKRLVTFSDNV